jgi:hypothetical protein
MMEKLYGKTTGHLSNLQRSLDWQSFSSRTLQIQHLPFQGLPAKRTYTGVFKKS